MRSARLRIAASMTLVCCFTGLALVQGQPVPEPGASKQPNARPITAIKTPIGDLLRQWSADGTAAGNVGDYYDNRDRGHSDLRTDPYPQLTRIDYTPDERKQNVDWAFQGRVLPHVVFGNSSTSAGVTNGGSNPRMGYSHPLGLPLLHQQYTHNNLYIYPEHRDHDPGHNGQNDGYGDVYPTNTPYLIISQGSSGSDQPFMRAVPLALASLRPEVKQKLTERGLIAPTLQMILRQTNKHLTVRDDYLTGKAHPTVFEGSWVDERKIVELAHEIERDSIPPFVQLRVLEEDETIRGLDYFDTPGSEKLGESPTVIARIHRAGRQQRRMLVSAEQSYDINDRPLKFHWVVLRGDPDRIQLTPRGEHEDQCEIKVAWHERRPVSAGSALESNRVDIGVFVHNGKYYSAPAFVTIFNLDDEARTYAPDGRVLEIGYGLGETVATVSNWEGLRELLEANGDSLAAKLLKQNWSADELAAVIQVARKHKPAQADADTSRTTSQQLATARQKSADALKVAQRSRDEAQVAHEKTPGDTTQAALQKADTDLASAKEADTKADVAARAARQQSDAANKAVADLLTTKPQGGKASIKDLVERGLLSLATDASFCADRAVDIGTLLKTADAGQRAAIENARRRLVTFGLLADGLADQWLLTPVREGDQPVVARLTRYERALIEQFNVELLNRLLFAGKATLSFRRNYVDIRLAVPKTWRDVYRYRPDGQFVGWTRYDGQTKAEFNRAGLLIVEKDPQGRCLKGQAVSYKFEDLRKDPRQFPAGTLKAVPEARFTRYVYANDSDWQGQAEPVPDAEK